MATIELQNISKSFGRDIVLDNVSLSVEEGEVLVLFGPSGAGKTVLLRLLAGVIEPDKGKVLIDGKDMFDIEPEERNVGMAFQNFALFPHMNAHENIASPLQARRKSADVIQSMVQRVSRILKIEHVLSHRPAALSNGQKQRTALARALVAEPGVLLLDDPLRNVDAKLRYEMRLEFPRLLSGQPSAVIYVTQDFREAMALGDKIVVLNAGKVVQTGTPAEIYQHPVNRDIAELFGDPVINLLAVTPQRSTATTEVEIESSNYALPEHLNAEPGHSYWLGIRPEHLEFCAAESQGAMAVTLEADTPLNEKIVSLVVTASGKELLVSRPTDSGFHPDEQTSIRFDPANAMLFDKNSGLNLSSSAGTP